MSHGVPRVQGSGGKSAQARSKELKQIEEYQGLVHDLSSSMKNKTLTRDTLNLTSKLLTWNPEYYTVWNHRRRIIANLLRDENNDITTEEMLVSDMQFLMPLLVKFPKCYWIWNHRHWLLQQCSELLSPSTARTIWTQELNLVGKMLARDSRNFHGWDYRRYVIGAIRTLNEQSHVQTQAERANDVPEAEGDDKEAAKQPSLIEGEYEYTTKMIKTNLSNFSAWHNRSKLIPRLLDERAADTQSRRALYDQEISLIDSAIFTDPYDQSLWFYHEFLIGQLDSQLLDTFVQFADHDCREHLEKEIRSISELLEDTTDCKLVYQHLLLYTSRYLALEGVRYVVSKADMRSWLDQLIKLDPLRKGRWQDLRKTLESQ